MAGEEAKSDRHIDLFGVRSLLFLPASNPRAIARAREAGADLVVLDLEDAVKPADKDAARDAAIAAVAEQWAMPVAIRINGRESEWQSRDLDAVAHSSADLIVVPRTSTASEVQDVAARVGRPVLAMVETAAGVLAAGEIARAAAALIAGTNDLRADLRLPLGSDRSPISTALQLIVLASRAAGIPCFDGVFNRLDDARGMLAEAQDGRMLGFDGKSLIHPNQIAPCHQAFAPTDEEVERAERLVEAFQGGAERFENEMIERMHIASAERVLARVAEQPR